MQLLEKKRATRAKRKADLLNRKSAAAKQRMRLIMQQANEEDVSYKELGMSVLFMRSSFVLKPMRIGVLTRLRAFHCY